MKRKRLALEAELPFYYVFRKGGYRGCDDSNICDRGAGRHVVGKLDFLCGAARRFLTDAKRARAGEATISAAAGP